VSKGIVVGLVDKGGYTWYSYGQPNIKTGKPLDNTALLAHHGILCLSSYDAEQPPVVL
jgi:hypothetical protein